MYIVIHMHVAHQYSYSMYTGVRVVALYATTVDLPLAAAC
jgi:hypothetical protein